jgi:hypothetical protein
MLSVIMLKVVAPIMTPCKYYFEYYLLLLLIANYHKIVTKFNVIQVNVGEPD